MPDTPAQTASRAVFLSHAHEDALPVRRISDGLRKAGIEVWFDQSELTGGDVWDAKIRRQIADCTLFIAVISANTQARLEGYFRIEWKLAAQRTHAMAEEKAFLLPVVIDRTREDEGKVPVEFRGVHWTRLPGGETTPAFVKCVRRLLDGGPAAGTVPPTAAENAVSTRAIQSRGVPAWARTAMGVAVALAALTAAVTFLSRREAGPERAAFVAVPAAKAAPPAGFDKRSLAVLPFDNFSSEKEKFDYFADGMTEQMISRLSRVRGLTVKARNAVLKFKGRRDIPAIGRELEVGTVLESSVRREGAQLRITVQLIDVQTQNHLWSQDFDEPFDKVLAIQSDVAERVAAELKVELLGEEKRFLRRRATDNAEAYDYYLRGRAYFAMNREATERSLVMLEKAIVLDDTFAEAHAELSTAYSSLAYFLEAGKKEWEQKAEAAAAKALRLNPELPEAHVAQARIFFRPSNGFQHEKAIAEVRRALALRSNLDDAYSFLGAIYFHVGLIDQSREQYNKADEINPGNPTSKFEIAVNELYHGRYEKALTLLEGYRSGFLSHFSEYRIASALFLVGRANDARSRIETLLDNIRNNPRLRDEGGILTAMQALLLAAAGDPTQAEAKIAEARKLGAGFGHFHHTAHVIASAYSLLNQPTPAMESLRYAAENGYPNITWFRRDPNLANLRKDPRFDELMAELQPRFERLKLLAETPIVESRQP